MIPAHGYDTTVTLCILHQGNCMTLDLDNLC
jgi:hypothetical protein